METTRASGAMLFECNGEGGAALPLGFSPRLGRCRHLCLTPFRTGSTISRRGSFISEGGVMGAHNDLPDHLTLAGRRLTRRDVLRYCFLSAAAVSVAAACGPSAAPAPPTAPPAAPTTAPAAKPTSAPA